ncbi:putative microsomal glutathione S-transferase 3 [Bisporella sp. PMI_857]|nr:putative microsomal glutathione S-transferase 3 [Bisporella sp. PMI_857]
MATVTIDPNYGYVLVVAASSFILNSLHSAQVGKFRKAAKVAYPAAYAPSARTDNEAYLFNCAQRAHANYIENQPSFLGALLLAGFGYPVSAGVLGGVWVVSRFAYMKGYVNGKKENGRGRYAGGLGMLQHVSIIGLTGMVAWKGCCPRNNAQFWEDVVIMPSGETSRD